MIGESLVEWAAATAFTALARLPLRIIVPLTEWNPKFDSAPWHVPVEPSEQYGLSKKSSADTFQVRSISEKRLVRKLGWFLRKSWIGSKLVWLFPSR